MEKAQPMVYKWWIWHIYAYLYSCTGGHRDFDWQPRTPLLSSPSIPGGSSPKIKQNEFQKHNQGKLQYIVNYVTTGAVPPNNPGGFSVSNFFVKLTPKDPWEVSSPHLAKSPHKFPVNQSSERVPPNPQKVPLLAKRGEIPFEKAGKPPKTS